MRNDCVLILIAGAGGFKGSGFFGPSPLNEHHDRFKVSYPDVPVLLLDWDTRQRIAPEVGGRNVLGVGHSFGGQRLLHQCLDASDSGATLIEAILVDPVRYAKPDAIDPTQPIDSNGLIQKLAGHPFPVPPSIRKCTCFLRKGGQTLLSYPESCPIAVDRAHLKNVPVKAPGLLDVARHAAICTTKDVIDEFWAAAERVFGPATTPPKSMKKKPRPRPPARTAGKRKKPRSKGDKR